MLLGLSAAAGFAARTKNANAASAINAMRGELTMMLAELFMFAGVAEFLDAMIIHVRNEDFIFGIDDDGVGQPELAGAGAVGAPVEQRPGLVVKNLHVVEQRIHDVNMAGGVHRDALGPAEAAGTVARAAELAEEFTGGIKDLNPAINRVRDVN